MRKWLWKCESFMHTWVWTRLGFKAPKLYKYTLTRRFCSIYRKLLYFSYFLRWHMNYMVHRLYDIVPLHIDTGRLNLKLWKDPVCLSSCSRDFVSCTSDCPCNENCFDGCPCSFQNEYCSSNEVHFLIFNPNRRKQIKVNRNSIIQAYKSISKVSFRILNIF